MYGAGPYIWVSRSQLQVDAQRFPSLISPDIALYASQTLRIASYPPHQRRGADVFFGGLMIMITSLLLTIALYIVTWRNAQAANTDVLGLGAHHEVATMRVLHDNHCFRDGL